MLPDVPPQIRPYRFTEPSVFAFPCLRHHREQFPVKGRQAQAFRAIRYGRHIEWSTYCLRPLPVTQ